ncbi:PAS domain-containing protein [Macrophomina phaseolina MS6]|uniref:PAS domain-containing protein n=1 Tax=Macrophomina phaseolina (strain MS6) TaxID=1126212 RepID=K2RPB5_MACPH|nr:PAS domain-containing protein [Macrophomina phaseolina MS6]
MTSAYDRSPDDGHGDVDFSLETSTITQRRPDPSAALDDIVLSSLHSLHFILSPSTTILRVSTNCLSLLGCEPNLLLGQRLAALIHRDDARVFNSELHDALRSPSSASFRFHCRIRSVVAADFSHSAFELLGNYQVTPPATLSPLQLMMPPPGIFSIMARPAVTKRGRELDGMLELKVEQIRLMRRIEDLQRQVAAADTDDDESPVEGESSSADPTRSSRSRVSSSSASIHKPSRSRSSPPRMGDESPATKAELLGAPSKAEIGDIGIPFLLRSRDSYASERSTDTERLTKRKFLGRQYRCSRCGRTDSPEWRRGPDGPKTLCNACGLMYSKAKRRTEKQLEQSQTGREEDGDADTQMADHPPVRQGARP